MLQGETGGVQIDTTQNRRKCVFIQRLPAEWAIANRTVVLSGRKFG
jgi:hypothetical protein